MKHYACFAADETILHEISTTRKKSRFNGWLANQMKWVSDRVVSKRPTSTI